MKLLSKNIQSLIKYKSSGKYCTAPACIFPSKDEVYTSTPEYPPIDQVDPRSEEGIKKQWYDKIKRQLTVEEKLFEVNVQRRWGWKCLTIHEEIVPFNSLNFAQHITRTHLIETEDLPDYYSPFAEKSKLLSSAIKNDVIDAIEYQLDIRRHKLSKTSQPVEQEKHMTRFIITELNRILMKSLWMKEPHLMSLQTDYSPRIEASWKIESLVETYVKKLANYNIPLEELPEEYLERPSDKYIQYMGQPILQLRALNPLPQLMDLAEACILTYAVPVFKYDPHLILGYDLSRRFLNNIPGFWPGDEREFSFISYHFSNHIKHRLPTYGPEDAKEALQSQAIFSSFGWLMPLACYQGFSSLTSALFLWGNMHSNKLGKFLFLTVVSISEGQTELQNEDPRTFTQLKSVKFLPNRTFRFSSFHEITYPLVTQTVLTDGREFTFAAYQLNTTELHWKNPFENLRSNICWVTSSKPLYEAAENGKVKGFNDEVLQKLTQLYLNVPKPLENVQLKPYLGDKIKHVADYDDDEKVEWLQEKFKNCCSNRMMAINSSIYEVRDWERFYKIMFQQRPFEARRRPFELRQNPYHQKLSDAPREYIPKELRPDGHLPKWKQKKFRRTFFPE